MTEGLARALVDWLPLFERSNNVLRLWVWGTLVWLQGALWDRLSLAAVQSVGHSVRALGRLVCCPFCWVSERLEAGDCGLCVRGCGRVCKRLPVSVSCLSAPRQPSHCCRVLLLTLPLSWQTSAGARQDPCCVMAGFRGSLAAASLRMETTDCCSTYRVSC